MDRKRAAIEILSSVAVLSSKKPAANLRMSTRGEAMVLHLASCKPGGITPGELQKAMEISLARVAAILSTLEAKGLLCRLSDNGDRRRIRIVLTPAGKERAAQNMEKIISNVEQSLTVLDDAEIQCCMRVLQKLEAFHSKQSEEKPC